MGKQLELFGDDTTTIRPRDPNVVQQEAPRLSRQCRSILERLRRGRATNDELSQIARKYTSRTSDLRKAGYDVRVVERDHVSGVTVYQLFE
jgi:hypothetical protein